MNRQQILEELLAILEQNGVAIRHEALGGGGGGLCTIKGDSIFFVDTQASSTEVAAMSSEAIAKIVDIESMYLRPEVRQFIEKYSVKRQ